MSTSNCPTDKEIHDAIDNCEWRDDVCGISVCKGQLGACQRIIQSGQCSTLQELFSKAGVGDENNH